MARPRSDARLRRAGLPASRHPTLTGSSGLVRVAAWVVAVEAVLLIALGIAGLAFTAGAGLTAQQRSEIIGFRMNPAHGLLLIGTGLLGLAALRHAGWLRRFVAAQTVGYLVLYVFGTALSVNTPNATMWNLNLADHVLHGALFIVGLVLTLMLYAGSRRTGRRDDQPGG